jgi:hypothetical protein
MGWAERRAAVPTVASSVLNVFSELLPQKDCLVSMPSCEKWIKGMGWLCGGYILLFLIIICILCQVLPPFLAEELVHI